MLVKLSLGLLGLATLATCATPYPFQTYDAGLFTPMEDLKVLSASEFTTLNHPLFPDYDVRIKKSDWCDGTVAYVFSRVFCAVACSH